jgi:inhibitor of cysteine peptidase
LKNRLSIVSIVCILIVVILIVSTILQSNYNINKIDDENTNVDKLPTVNTKEKLTSLLTNYNTRNYMVDGVIAPSTELNTSQKGATAADTDYSTTNTQVQGVDEADLVKTDGKYIYSISKGDLIIAEATPAESMNITTNLFKDETVNPIEMMINDNYLTVICNNNNYNIYDGVKSMMMPYYNSDTTTIYVYNISDKKNIVKVKTMQIDGSYLTSRAVNNSVYVITNKYVWNNASEDIRPKYSIDGSEKTIDYDKIFYFPGTNCSSYTMVGIIDLLNISNEPKVTSYLSSAQNVYMSLDNLYITTSSISNGNIQTFAIDTDYTSVTSIYKFSIKNKDTEFIARAELKGSTLNQFSMDEYNGFFRVTLNNNTDNSLYIFDENMNISGKITGIAKGEKIYSTRFIKDRAYVVTFKTMDPLFVIDVKDPTNPKILGELKIPGYSSYLHEYDENHIIGIGQDTTEINDKDSNGKIINTRYVTNGMKMAIFDVTDVTNPKQQFSTKIGNKYTYSDVLYNPKAFLFSKDKNLLALPVDIYNEDVSIQTGMLRSEETTTSTSNNRFQGLLVYNIDLVNGFTEKGRITHYGVESAESNKLYYSYDYLNNIKRGLYINNTLYTVSENKIMASDLNTLKEINSLNLK